MVANASAVVGALATTTGALLTTVYKATKVLVEVAKIQ